MARQACKTAKTGQKNSGRRHLVGDGGGESQARLRMGAVMVATVIKWQRQSQLVTEKIE